MRFSISRMAGSVALLSLAACSLACNGAAAQARFYSGGGISLPLSYHVYDLGTLGGNSSNALAINNNNQIVGWSEVTTYSWFSWIQHGFSHTGFGALTSADNLGTLGGWTSCAYAVNNAGTVVGTSQDANGNSEAFHHVGSGPLTPQIVTRFTLPGIDNYGDLGEGAGIANDGWATATGINDSDTFVGSSPALGPVAAFVHNPGQGCLFNRLLFMCCPSEGPSYAYGVSNGGGVNGRGIVVGQCSVYPSTFYHAMDVYNIWWTQFSDMGTFGGDNSCALAINASSTTVGWSEVFSGYNIRRAFRHKVPAGQDPSIIGVGVMNAATDALGSLGGWNSEARAINKYNVTVGKSDISSASSATHAFFYDIQMNDLNNFLDSSGAGWTLTEANGINDGGVIVGQGLINGQYHAFAAVPNPRVPFLP